MRMREYSLPLDLKTSSNKTVSKIDNVSVKHSGFDETAFFKQEKSVSRNIIAILIAEAYLDRMFVPE